ncbi:soluble secreted recptor for CD30 ligand [Cowpox virus]|nr:soluble secreted recptor for CD30 ligand [Cowpox virus]
MKMNTIFLSAIVTCLVYTTFGKTCLRITILNLKMVYVRHVLLV